MAYELKNGQGNIWKNNNKASENHPEYKGTIKTPEGKEYDLALWVKQGQKGKYFSVSIQEPYRGQDQPQTTQATNEDNDDLPF